MQYGKHMDFNGAILSVVQEGYGFNINIHRRVHHTTVCEEGCGRHAVYGLSSIEDLGIEGAEFEFCQEHTFLYVQNEIDNNGGVLQQKHPMVYTPEDYRPRH